MNNLLKKSPDNEKHLKDFEDCLKKLEELSTRDRVVGKKIQKVKDEYSVLEEEKPTLQHEIDSTQADRDKAFKELSEQENAIDELEEKLKDH